MLGIPNRTSSYVIVLFSAQSERHCLHVLRPLHTTRITAKAASKKYFHENRCP